MSDAPAPLTPPDCDLRDFPFMPLEVQRLRASKSWIRAKRDPALGFYLVNLWTASWHQVPAASLEDDDEILCEQAMCDPKVWPRVRDKVLAGWTKCSDGRFYHPTVAEKALDSWDRKQRQRQKTTAAREALAQRRRQEQSAAATATVTASVTETDTEIVTASKGQGQGQGEIEDPLTPKPGGLGGSSDLRSEERPPRRSRAHGTNPRALAAAEAAARPPSPEPEHALWPALKARGVTPADFRAWVAPLASVPATTGRTVFVAPSRFVADRVRADWTEHLAAATGGPVEIRGPIETAAHG